MRGMRVAAPLLSLVVVVAAAPVPSTAHAQSSASIPFDAYIASGDASCFELTVNVAGYSFIVEPDVRIPRATSTISEGQSGALAAPIDPGDSVDALSGLLVPREEGQLASGIDSGLSQAPLPIPGDPGNALIQAVNPFNPTLEYPIEHASASYPQPGSTADQHATYLGANNLAVSDPSGLLSLDATAGSADAAAQSATANAGSGAALSVSTLGISLGRLAAHSQSQVSQTSVTSDVSCNLSDLSISPPGSGYTLHISSMLASLHSERSLKGKSATSSPSLRLSGMTVSQSSGGTTTTTDLSPAGKSITVPDQLGNVALPQPPVLPLPLSLPVPMPVPASLQSVGLAGTTTNIALSSAGNEVTSSLTAATLTLQTTAPLPATIPTGPPPCLTNPQEIVQCLPQLVPVSPGGGLPITSSPATYTLQLANLASTAYGFTAPPSAPLSFSGLLPGSSPTGSLAPAGAAADASPGTPGTPGTKPVSATVSVPGIPASIRWPVVALAGVLEALLLTALFFRRRAGLRARVPGPPPDSFVDLP